MKKLRVAVIGGGASGLCAIKNGLDYGCDVVAFEQTNAVGGLWNYTDETEKDKYGLEIHSSMYQNLITNLPIELMCYPNEPFREQRESFVSSHEVLNYYRAYAEKYDLARCIKFRHHVLSAKPLEDDTWAIAVKNLPEDTIETHHFDAVLVCSGHFHASSTPTFEGQATFKGRQLHSHVYRCADIFRDERTLIVGGNNSAVDLLIDCTRTSRHATIWSHHLPSKPDLEQFHGPVIEKPDILELTETGARFVDGSFEECSMIVYATGYLYAYPFLSADCGVTSGEYVRPLWMHCLSINRPTLGFIGLPNLICPNQMFQLQVEFCLTFMTQRRQLPTREQMFEEFELDMLERWKKGLSKRKGHYLGHNPDAQQKYYDELARRAGVEGIKPCIVKMHSHAHANRMRHFTNYRNVKYTIVDDHDFTVAPL